MDGSLSSRGVYSECSIIVVVTVVVVKDGMIKQRTICCDPNVRPTESLLSLLQYYYYYYYY